MLTKQFIQVSTAIALMAISIIGFAQNKVVVIPLFGDDAPTSPISKTIFVTSQSYNGDLGGISGADDKCQAEADGATPPVPGIFKAWLSTDITASIPVRASFIKHDLPYNNVNGDNVANNFDDFLDGAFNSVIDIVNSPDFGLAVVWTGTEEGGDDATFENCNDWTTDSTFGRAAIGFSNGGVVENSSFSFNQTMGCEQPAKLYCFEQ